MKDLKNIFTDNPQIEFINKFASGVSTMIRNKIEKYTTVQLTELNCLLIEGEGYICELYPNTSQVHKFILDSELK